MPAHGRGLNQTSCPICTLTQHPNLLLPPQDMVPCWVAHTQDPSPQGTMIWGFLPHPYVLFGPTQTPTGFGVTPSPWEANQDFWFLPHDCSAPCTQGECLEKNPPWRNSRVVISHLKGPGEQVWVPTPNPQHLLAFCALFFHLPARSVTNKSSIYCQF